MFPILLSLFIAIPVIEIALIIQVGSVLGGWITILLILLTAIVGTSLVRSQGLQTLLTVQQRVERGELPAEQIMEGVMIAGAGVLLLTPGFVTDTLGIVLLLPWARQRLIKKIAASKKFTFNSNFQQHTYRQSPFESQQGNTFEGEFERKKQDQDKLN